MGRRLSGLSLAATIGLAAAGADAGTLTGATWLQAEDIRFQRGVLGTVPLTRSFAQLGASGSSTATSIAVSLSYPSFTTDFILPKTPNCVCPHLAIHLGQGGPQAITATAGMGAGTPGVPGTLILMTASHAAMGVNQSMFKVGVNTVVAVPLSHGQAGQFTNTFTLIGTFVQMTVDFYAWTPGTLVFTGLTELFDPLPNVTVMGSFDLTPNGGGTVTLVSPSRLSIDGGLQRRTVSFATLQLSFVPEPGSLLLLAAAGLALGLVAGRRPS